MKHEGTSTELNVGAISSRFVSSYMQGRRQVIAIFHASVID